MEAPMLTPSMLLLTTMRASAYPTAARHAANQTTDVAHAKRIPKLVNTLLLIRLDRPGATFRRHEFPFRRGLNLLGRSAP
jgi:hypothetical protein